MNMELRRKDDERLAQRGFLLHVLEPPGEGESRNIVDVIVSLMQAAERFAGGSLTGEQKKQLVLDTALQYLRHPKFDGNIAVDAMEKVLPFVIDWLVVADRGGLALNPRAVSCWGSVKAFGRSSCACGGAPKDANKKK